MALSRIGIRTARASLARPFSVSTRIQSDVTPKDLNEQSSGGEIVKPTSSDEVVTADATSGAPAQLRHRAVRIYQPTRNTMQSGGAKSNRWRIDWEILQGAGRWENPLMGWASSGDYMQGTRMSFSSKEAAIKFAEEQGWDYYVQVPMIKKIPPKNYAENYLYNPKELRIQKTK